MRLRIEKLFSYIEHHNSEADPSNIPLRKVAAVGVVENPYAGQQVADLRPLIEASKELGRELADSAMSALGPYPVQSYGKGAVVGIGGEQEHANALITTAFAEPLRVAVGGGKAWISSFTKRAAPGATIDIPLASKDALYVRSHYDGMTITLPDAPLPNQIAVIVCIANRGRLNARVGGLRFEDMRGEDGLL